MGRRDGDVDKPEADYTAAIELEGSEPATRAWAYYGRAIVRSRDGRRLRTVADYTAAIEHEGAEPAIRARAFNNRGNLRRRAEEAEADYTAAIDLGAAAPDDARGNASPKPCGRWQSCSEAWGAPRTRSRCTKGPSLAGVGNSCRSHLPDLKPTRGESPDAMTGPPRRTSDDC